MEGEKQQDSMSSPQAGSTSSPQAIILAAGKGSRMQKAHKGAKQLLRVGDRPILQHAVDNLPKEVREVVLVVGGPHENQVRAFVEKELETECAVHLVRQDEPRGTAHAFGCAREYVRGRFLGLMGDDLYTADDLARLVEHERAVLASRVENPEHFGVLEADGEGRLVRAVEKPQEFISDLVSTGAMVMDKNFFACEAGDSVRGERECPDIWAGLIENGTHIQVVPARHWLPINDSEQLKRAQAYFLGQT